MSWAGIVGAGGMTGWAAYATSWLNAWGPIAWVGSGLLGAFVTCSCFFLYAAIKNQLSQARFNNSLSKAPRTINPMEQHFIKKIVPMIDFYSPFAKTHISRTFEDSELIGPAVVYLSGFSNLTDCNLATCDFVELKEGDVGINNVVHFHDFTIKRCMVYRVTFLMPHNSRDNFVQGNWIT